MKLVLDRSALDRLLLNDDGSIKLELRNSIIQAFASKHLRSVINDEFYQKHLQVLQNIGEAIVKEEICEKVESNFFGYTSINLKPHVKHKIVEEANTAVNKALETTFIELDEKVNKLIREYDFESEIEKKINTYIENLYSELFSQAAKYKLEDIIEQEINKRIKEKLSNLLE